MKHSDSIASLAASLVAVHGELRAIGKDSTNPHFKNKYASLDAIIEAVRPVLHKHGLAVAQGATTPVTNEAGNLVGFAVETMLIHSSGEWMTNTAILPLAKADPQGAGGAMTYGRRYGLSALLALATEEDDDGHAASAPRKAAPQARPTPAPDPIKRASPEQIARLQALLAAQTVNQATRDLVNGQIKNGIGEKKAANYITQLEANTTNGTHATATK